MKRVGGVGENLIIMKQFLSCVHYLDVWNFLINAIDNHSRLSRTKSALEFCHLIKSIIRDLVNLITIMVAAADKISSNNNEKNKVFSSLSAAIIVGNVCKKIPHSTR
jgi:hypothetical protein